MKKSKRVRSVVSLFLILGAFMASAAMAQASEIQPRYTGISQLSTGLRITSAGAAICDGSVDLRSGYTVDLTVELKQDGTTIKTWTASGVGSDVVSAGGTYYVASGHKYVVTTTAVVYDKNGNVVESPSENSARWTY